MAGARAATFTRPGAGVTCSCWGRGARLHRRPHPDTHPSAIN